MEMGRKSCCERADECSAEAARRVREGKETRDPGSYFVNMDQNRTTNRARHGNKLFFRVKEDGSLEKRP